MSPLLLMTMACVVGGAPASLGSASEASAQHVQRAAQHARVVLAEAGRMQELSVDLADAGPDERAALRQALARARDEHAALREELEAAQAALRATPDS